MKSNDDVFLFSAHDYEGNVRLTTENVTFFSPPHLEPTRTLKDLIDAPLSSVHPCLSLYLSLCKLGKLFMLH